MGVWCVMWWYDTCVSVVGYMHRHAHSTLVKFTWDLLGTGVLVETRSPRFGCITSAAVSDACACGVYVCVCLGLRVER